MIVGDDMFRAVCRRNPEQLHPVIHREPVYLDGLPSQPFVAEPLQFGNGFVRAFALAVIDFPVGFKRAVKHLKPPCRIMTLCLIVYAALEHRIRQDWRGTVPDLPQPEGQTHGTPLLPLGVPVLHRHPPVDTPVIRRGRVEPQSPPQGAAHPARQTLCRHVFQFWIGGVWNDGCEATLLTSDIASGPGTPLQTGTDTPHGRRIKLTFSLDAIHYRDDATPIHKLDAASIHTPPLV